MPRQPESLAVPGLHPDLIRPQLRIITSTKMVLWDKQYNSHFLAYSCTIFNEQLSPGGQEVEADQQVTDQPREESLNPPPAALNLNLKGH